MTQDERDVELQRLGDGVVSGTLAHEGLEADLLRRSRRSCVSRLRIEDRRAGRRGQRVSARCRGRTAPGNEQAGARPELGMRKSRVDPRKRSAYGMACVDAPAGPTGRRRAGPIGDSFRAGEGEALRRAA